MKMSLRWFGPKQDPISLQNIRQIPGVEGVITTLYEKMAGEEWTSEEINSLKKTVEDSGLKILGIESMNISDEIKVGHSLRDLHIERYNKSLARLSDAGIHMVCYNFMTVFDWLRTDLAKVRPDGSTAMAYEQAKVDELDPEKMFENIDQNSNGYMMPGWEPERMAKIKELFELYADIDENKLRENLKYFLEGIMPTCEKYGVKMAVHMDDPSWSIFGLPRIVKNLDDLKIYTELVDSEYNGLTLCTGSLSSSPDNDIPSIIRAMEGKIHFAHVRNTLHTSPGNFEESAHLSRDGSLDMYEIIKALHDINFEGPIRPDHGRAIWGEQSMPGYGLYDRALGSQYLLGLEEAIKKQENLK
ncbi:MAG: mannonate dehydratase [Spirochaetales bacterium]|nr:mannonate dehydratase [Spirochaetales bacterium]